MLKRKVFVWLDKLQKNKQRISLDLELSKKAQVSTYYRRRISNMSQGNQVLNVTNYRVDRAQTRDILER